MARGEIVAVLGKTGCGKSTIFNLIAGLAEPTSGRISVDGLDPFGEFAALRGKIGIVFQGDRLMPWRTAIDNVLLGFEILGVERTRVAGDRARSGSPGSASPATRTTTRTRSPAACASASRSPARSPSIRC